jgi:hypothetical protein
MGIWVDDFYRRPEAQKEFVTGDQEIRRQGDSDPRNVVIS